jgi:hypothetical protein
LSGSPQHGHLSVVRLHFLQLCPTASHRNIILLIRILRLKPCASILHARWTPPVDKVECSLRSASSSGESQNDSSCTNVSPPRYQYPRQNHNGARSSREESDEESDDQSSSRPDSDHTYDEANIGKVMRDSLIILGLDFSSSCNDAKAQYRLLASKYHPDKHSLFGAETGMTIQETTHFFQLINSAYTYLCTKL